MARTRLDFHKLLQEVTQCKNIYFRPPSLLKYPCIIYDEDRPSVYHADNSKYKTDTRYTVTVIDANPDSKYPALLDTIPMSGRDRNYQADNLNHWVFTIYF